MHCVAKVRLPGLTKATCHRVRTGAPAQPEGERTNTWDLRRQPALVSAQKLHLNQRVKPQKTNETFNTGRTPDHVTSKLEKKPQHKRPLQRTRANTAYHRSNTSEQYSRKYSHNNIIESEKEGRTTKTPNVVKIARS